MNIAVKSFNFPNTLYKHVGHTRVMFNFTITIAKFVANPFPTALNANFTKDLTKSTV